MFTTISMPILRNETGIDCEHQQQFIFRIKFFSMYKIVWATKGSFSYQKLINVQGKLCGQTTN